MKHKIIKELIAPDSIVVVGGSNNLQKPGGKLVYNILKGTFKGRLYVLNPHEKEVQGVVSYSSIGELPSVDLAILAIPANMCLEVVKQLIQHGTKAFIIISAGFAEEGEAGARLELELVENIRKAGGILIGPNCIGLINSGYQAVFTTPVPKISPEGCSLISGSGATAVFILEAGMPKGLSFSEVYSVGNSAMIGVEEILEYMDETFDPALSSRIKLLYIESIRNPDKLLKHSASLIRKGCRIAAIKAGSSEAGSRAAYSHTGALTSSDLAVDALFRKAGIVRCYGREELTTVASVFMYKKLKGRNIAIVTQAGGPAIMLTDALVRGGMNIPRIKGEYAEELLSKLNPGSSVSNPIDLLATGTAEHLDMAIEYCDKKFENIDAIMVIFGSTGLSDVFDIVDLLHRKIEICNKPIYPIIPTLNTARIEVESFLKKGHINFPEEVVLANALNRVINTPEPADDSIFLQGVETDKIKKIIDNAGSGFLPQLSVHELLDAAGIPRVPGIVVKNEKQLSEAVEEIAYPLVMKIIGPVHKTDVGGVTLNIKSENHLLAEYHRMKMIPGFNAVLIQPMLQGLELFAGAKYEHEFGHIVLCGLGGIYIEIIRDVASGLAPLTFPEAISMIRSLKSYKIIQGVRGNKGVDENKFAGIIMRLSSVLRFATEIKEVDLNPLIGVGDYIFVVDARVRIEKE